MSRDASNAKKMSPQKPASASSITLPVIDVPFEQVSMELLVQYQSLTKEAWEDNPLPYKFIIKYVQEMQ